MPDNFDDEQIDNMSINDINELFEDVIEIPDNFKLASFCQPPITIDRPSGNIK